MTLLLRIREAALAFTAPHLVASGIVQEDLEDVQADLEAVKADIAFNVDLQRHALLAALDAGIVAAFNAVTSPKPRGDDEWWDGYSAALKDSKAAIAELRGTAQAQIREAIVKAGGAPS